MPKFPAPILHASEANRAMATDPGSRPKRLAGREEANVDDKGRVLFSKRKRDILGDDFVMRLGDSGCIYVYASTEWDEVTAELDRYPKNDLGRQTYTRLLMGTVVFDLNFDAQGRTVIPRMLRDMAKIDGSVVIVGCDERAEIWAADEFAKFEADMLGYGRERMDLFDEARRRMRGEF